MNALIDRLFALGKAKGFTEQEVYYASSESTVIESYRGEIEKFNMSRDAGLSYRGIIDGKLGYSFTECVDDSSLEMLVDEAYSNGKAIGSEDKVFLFGEKRDYVPVNRFDASLADVPMQDKIAFPIRLEARIRELAPEVSDVMHCTYMERAGELRIRNTMGLDLSSRSNYCVGYGMAMLTQDGETYTAGDGDAMQSFGQLDIEKLAQETVKSLRAQIGGKPAQSGAYKILLRYDAFAQLLETFLGLFDADRVQKDLSAFKDKLGQPVASPALSIEDDPHLADGVASASFDAEGYPTMRKSVIERGVLKTFFHNLKTAYKAGVSSTGNASKAGYKGAIGIAPFNLVLSTGDKDFEQLAASIGDGIMINDLAGLHSGVNDMSGDFSLMASGHRIRDGKIAEPVRQVTVSGNFFELLMQIEEMGSDRRYALNTSIYTPSVVVRALTVSGV